MINEFYRPNKFLTKIIIENYIKLKRYLSFYIKKDLFIKKVVVIPDKKQKGIMIIQ